MSIEIDSLYKYFTGQVVFSNFCARIPYGQPTIITGPSGCGKTTLLRIISGLDRKYTGSVTGVPKEISYLFQEDRLLPWLTLKQNVEFVLWDVLDHKSASESAQQMIDAVKLSGHENKPPADLSGGMQRRTALARAFCYPGSLLLLDEPFKGLDARLKIDMIELFDKLFIKTKKTVVIVSHDETVLERFGHNVIDLECAYSAASLSST